MSNYIIRVGRTWSVKVSIPADVQKVIGKRAFKQSLQTTDKTVAITRSAPLIAKFKDAIAQARGNPAQHLNDYLQDVQDHLRVERANPDADFDAISGVEEEALTKLLEAHKVQHFEQLPKGAQTDVVNTYKVTTGRITPFADPIEDYLEGRHVEAKTASKEKLAINEFAVDGTIVQKVDRKSVRAYVRKLSQERGLKSKTIRDRLGFLGLYWKWLVDNDYAPEDSPNPFAGVDLPKENRKDAAEDARLPFTVSDISKLHTSIMASDLDMLKAAFMIAIYTGCRIEEIASLECANVTDDTMNIQRAKSLSGNRDIPIHDSIKPLVAELKGNGHQYLLSDLTADQDGGRSLGIRRGFTKIKNGLKYDGRYVFHSLRKTVATQLEQAGVPEGVAADILGHKKKTMSYGLYSGGSLFEQKREAVLKLDYGLD